jgi:hypothetical protein
MNVIATAFNGAQSECHGSTATKTQFGIQSSPMLETVSPDKLVMAAPSTRGIAVQSRALRVIALIMTLMASGDHSYREMTKLSLVASLKSYKKASFPPPLPCELNSYYFHLLPIEHHT